LLARRQGLAIPLPHSALYGSPSLKYKNHTLGLASVSSIRQNASRFGITPRRFAVPHFGRASPSRTAPFHDLDRQIPQFVKDQLNQLAQGLANDPTLDEVPYQKP